MAYDIIGDIHGQADKLHGLLAELGYENRGGAYRHKERTAIFVGDFIDRGPGQLESVMTVRRMVDAGSAQAIMGNHEFNAIAWHTPDRDHHGEFLRPHDGEIGKKNRSQHAAFPIVVARLRAVWMYSYVPYATPIKALHHAHVYSPVARKATFAPPCGPQRGCGSLCRNSR